MADRIKLEPAYTYRPRPAAFWYGTVCGFCLATSIAAFTLATRYLGVW